jgi:two-component system, LytTR family, response regulator
MLAQQLSDFPYREHESAQALWRIAVVHPEPSPIIRLIGKFPDLKLVAQATNGTEAIHLLRERETDVVVIGTALHGMSALALTDALAHVNKPLAIIVGSSDVSAAEAFDRGVFDVVVEAVPAARLELALARAKEHLERTHVTSALRSYARAVASHSEEPHPDRRIALITPRRVVLVEPHEIDWAEAAQARVIVCARSKQYPVQESLTEFERRLPRGRFIRIRRSVIVNISCIGAIQSRGHGELAVTLRGGRRVAVGATYREGVEQLTKPLRGDG